MDLYHLLKILAKTEKINTAKNSLTVLINLGQIKLQQIQYKTILKKTIEKTAERTGNLFGNKNVDKITKVSNTVNGNEYIFIYEGYINIKKLSLRSL